jgi:anti-sigma B factor antagonist
MQNHFQVERSSRGAATVLALSGELDLASSPALEQELEHALEEQDGPLLIDLRQLDFIDSTGLSVLVKAHQRAEERGRRFGLVGGGSQVRRLLNLTGLADRLPLAESPEELLGHD